ncbi:MAG: putative DNA-binding domain-containing protein [Gammaproteobacteria bacterium]|nr:putative DNA-binding domain-containing protein [Gammaproteobacteria bacterium]MDH5302838.1 putative DNA-binding domain-containing protein [Gammaproteobacteria bacterium]
MPERPDFQQRQFAFAAHIRDPQNVAVPDGIEDRRMAVYRELFFNNLRSLLSNMFPVLKKLLGAEAWSALIRQFLKKHRSTTPYFLQLPAEFLEFLQHEYEARDTDPPFLLELAHYEYIELALSISELSNDMCGVDPGGNLLADAPVKSELAWAFAYQFPVHRISPQFKPVEPGATPTYLAVYRNSTDKVGFLELNPMSAGLLDAIDNNSRGLSGRSLLLMLAKQTHYPDAEALVLHGATALREMRKLEILTGTRAARQ